MVARRVPREGHRRGRFFLGTGTPGGGIPLLVVIPVARSPSLSLFLLVRRVKLHVVFPLRSRLLLGLLDVLLRLRWLPRDQSGCLGMLSRTRSPRISRTWRLHRVLVE